MVFVPSAAPAAISLAGPVVMQIQGLWHLVVAAVIGMCAGLPLGAWFNAKGVTGVVAEVKADMARVQADVATLKVAKSSPVTLTTTPAVPTQTTTVTSVPVA
jgi:hypothetical protein